MNRTTTSRRRARARRGSTAVLLALALAATACGSSGDASAPAAAAGSPLAEDPATPAATTTAPPPTTTSEPPAPTTTTPPPPTTTSTRPPPAPTTTTEPVDELWLLVDDAVAASIESGTATTTGTVTTAGEEVASFAGMIDFAGPSFAGDLTFAGDPPLAIIIHQEVVYVAFPDLPLGATWRLLTSDEFGYPPARAVDHPLGFLVAIDAAAPGEPVVDLGEADGGAAGERLQVTLDVELLLAGAGVGPAWFGAWSADELQASALAEIEDGRLIRLTLTVEPRRGSEEYRQELAFTAVYSLGDFGEAPGVEPPAAAEVITADDYGVPVGELMVGDCFVDLGPGAGVELVPCDEPHQGEVFATFEIPGGSGDSFPGDEAAWDTASAACLAEFEGYVGEPFATSPLDFFAWFPSAETWASGDRLVVCAATMPDGSPLDAGVRDREF